MFSKSCEYGIRASVFIAERSSQGKKSSIQEIARQTDSPEAFTAKILRTLAKRRIIISSKGPSGGFFMPSPAEVKLIEIVSAMDGEAIFKGCALGLDGCSDDAPCPLHDGFKRIRDTLEGMLRSVSMEDLIANLHSKQTFLKRQSP